MILEKNIDEITEELSASIPAYEHTLRLMSEQQPTLLSYLFSDNFSVFTQEEQAFTLFLTTVIWKSVFQDSGSQAMITEDQISEAEEYNWTLLETLPSHSFRERMDVFFADSQEEDLLAFIEDALLDDEESPVTPEGREPLFVTLKAFVDCLTAANE